MQKLALINLILLLAVKFVIACELPEETKPVVLERLFYDNLFFYSSLALIFPIIILGFLKKGKGVLIPVIVFPASLLYVILTFFAGISDSCGDGCPTDICGNSSSNIIKIGFAVFLLLFLYQIISWIDYRKTLKIKLR